MRMVGPELNGVSYQSATNLPCFDGLFKFERGPGIHKATHAVLLAFLRLRRAGEGLGSKVRRAGHTGAGSPTSALDKALLLPQLGIT